MGDPIGNDEKQNFGGNMKTILVFFLVFVASPASAQLADVLCKVSGGQFVCKVGRGDDPTDLTLAVTHSVQLFRDDAPGFPPFCADMPPGVDVVLMGFVILFEPGVKPMMKAIAFGEAGCAGLTSSPSENSGKVTHNIPGPKMLRMSEPPSG